MLLTILVAAVTCLHAQQKAAAKSAPTSQVSSSSAPLHKAAGQIPSFGGSYEQLRPAQRKLVDDWIEGYNRRTGKNLIPEKSYNAVPISTRTTFEAVTHALLITKLTDKQNQPLGTALDLIASLEAVKGKVPGARGDMQFRIYVTLRPDAIQTLEQSTQFNRKGDNKVFHYGYPMNFRQGGGFPSIQISSDPEGTRADIDVDYLSAGFPAGLLNGHLSAANSDVRAGNNYRRHTKRWSGLGNWWHNVFGIPVEDDHAFSPQAEADIATTAKSAPGLPLDLVVAEFLSKWLVEKKPNIAVAYFAPRAYACFEPESAKTPAKGPVPRPLWNQMEETNYLLGSPTQLSDAVSPVDVSPLGLTPVAGNANSPYTVAKLPLDLARKFDCAPSGQPKLGPETTLRRCFV